MGKLKHFRDTDLGKIVLAQPLQIQLCRQEAVIAEQCCVLIECHGKRDKYTSDGARRRTIRVSQNGATDPPVLPNEAAMYKIPEQRSAPTARQPIGETSTPNLGATDTRKLGVIALMAKRPPTAQNLAKFAETHACCAVLRRCAPTILVRGQAQSTSPSCSSLRRRISVQKASCEKRRGNGPLAVPEAAAPESVGAPGGMAKAHCNHSCHHECQDKGGGHGGGEFVRTSSRQMAGRVLSPSSSSCSYFD